VHAIVVLKEGESLTEQEIIENLSGKALSAGLVDRHIRL
jgi:hypothetical protein